MIKEKPESSCMSNYHLPELVILQRGILLIYCTDYSGKYSALAAIFMGFFAGLHVPDYMQNK